MVGGMGLVSQGLSLKHSRIGGRREQGVPEGKLTSSPEEGEPGDPWASEATPSFRGGNGPQGGMPKREG